MTANKKRGVETSRKRPAGDPPDPPAPTTQAENPIKKRRFSVKSIAVQPTALRRPCAAKNRFTTWRAPLAATSTKHLPAGDRDKLRTVLHAAYADSTLQGYSTALASFMTHCDQRGVPEKKRAPADPNEVLIWAAKDAGKLSVGYISDRIAGLRAWHECENIPWLLDEKTASLVRRGARSMQPDPKPPRPPMRLSWLLQVVANTDYNDHQEVAATALAAVGFWGLFRVGELTVNTPTFKAKQHITRDKAKEGSTADGKVAVTVQLPKTKTKPLGQTVVINERVQGCDPVSLLRMHRDLNETDSPDGSTPLFAYKTEGGMKAMTRTAFLATTANIAMRAGLGDVDGHSMRIGGCTTLLCMGLPVDKVMLLGRWIGMDSFKRYIRDHVEVMAPYLVTLQGSMEAMSRVDKQLPALIRRAQEALRATAPASNTNMTASETSRMGNDPTQSRDARNEPGATDTKHAASQERESAHASVGLSVVSSSN